MSDRLFLGLVAVIHLLCLSVLIFDLSSPPNPVPVFALNNFTLVFSAGQTTGVPVAAKVEPAKPSPALFFVGDIMLGRHVESRLIKSGSDYPYEQVSFLKKEPAYVIGNFEASVPREHIKTPNFGFTFSVDRRHLPALKAAGFTHLSLANNHAYDFGQAGYGQTKKTLSELGLETFGNPLDFSIPAAVTFLDTGSTTVALIGLHTLFKYPLMSELRKLTTYAKERSDYQIVYIHWGEEYQLNQSAKQRQLATQLAELGVSLIIGHHPHVTQGIERINNTLVFYSLGNFIFDQYFSSAVQEGLVLKLQLDANGLVINLIPVTSELSQTQPRPMEEAEARLFLASLASRSDETLAKMIAFGLIDHFYSLATSSEMAIMGE